VYGCGHEAAHGYGPGLDHVRDHGYVYGGRRESLDHAAHDNDRDARDGCGDGDERVHESGKVPCPVSSLPASIFLLQGL